MPSVDDILKRAKPVERVVHVCVAGDISGEYEDLKLELEGSEHVARLSSTPDPEKTARLAELEDQMLDATFEFRLRALSAHGWSNLLAEHPDTTGNLIFNGETFPPALIAKTCVEPEGMDDPEKVSALFDVLSPSQQNDLFDAAWEIHQTSPKGPIS